MKKLLALGIGSSFIGMVLLVVGIATVQWLHADGPFVTSDVGLWQSCNSHLGVTVCQAYDMSRLNRNSHIARAFAVIGSILAISGVVTACCGGGTDTEQGKNGGGGTIIAAGVCGMIAAGVFTLDNGGLSTVSLYGYSFYLTWVQALFTIGGGIAIIVGGREGSTTVQPLGGGPATGQPTDGGQATVQPVSPV